MVKGGERLVKGPKQPFTSKTSVFIGISSQKVKGEGHFRVRSQHNAKRQRLSAVPTAPCHSQTAELSFGVNFLSLGISKIRQESTYIMTIIAGIRNLKQHIIIGTCTLLIYSRIILKLTQIKEIVNKTYRSHSFLTFQSNNYIIFAIEQKSISIKQNMYIHS